MKVQALGLGGRCTAWLWHGPSTAVCKYNRSADEAEVVVMRSQARLSSDRAPGPWGAREIGRAHV